MYVSKRLALQQSLLSLSDAWRLSGTNKLYFVTRDGFEPPKDAKICAFATTQKIRTVSNKGELNRLRTITLMVEVLAILASSFVFSPYFIDLRSHLSQL